MINQEHSYRIEAYIRNVEYVLEKLKNENLDFKIREILEIVEAYLKDSKYYLSKGDYFTALATIAYAEGLLDALRLLGLVKFEWLKSCELMKKAFTKVLTAGTFEILHPGHIMYLKEAWNLGRVITIVSRDETVKKIKGRDVIIPEDQRLEVIKHIYYVHKARLGYTDDMFRVIEEEKPNIIFLGPDQPIDENTIVKEVEKRGLKGITVIRMSKVINKDLYSTTKIINRILERLGK